MKLICAVLCVSRSDGPCYITGVFLHFWIHDHVLAVAVQADQERDHYTDKCKKSCSLDRNLITKQQKSTQKLYSLTNIVRAVQSKLRNSKIILGLTLDM